MNPPLSFSSGLLGWDCPQGLQGPQLCLGWGPGPSLNSLDQRAPGLLGEKCSQPTSTIFQMGKLRPRERKFLLVGSQDRNTDLCAPRWLLRGPSRARMPPSEPRSPRGNAGSPNSTQHQALWSRTPGVLLAKLTNGGLFPVCRQRSFSGEHFHSLQSFSPELLCKPLAPAAAGLGGKQSPT